MWWIAVASAADMSFQCTDTATLPEHVVAWDKATASGPVDDAWDAAYAWYDAACVTCTSDTAYELCEATACVTAAGAVLDYHAEYAVDYRDTNDYTETTIDTISVVPPISAGLGWSALTVTIEERGGSSTSSSGGGNSTGTTSWVGELRPDWPVDGGFTTTARSSSDSSYYSFEDGSSWDDGTCAWTILSEVNTFARTHTVRMRDHTYKVVFVTGRYGECGSDQAAAYIDDLFVGVPDETTWSLLGTDADGDRWPAEHGDCNDADPAINPCAEDPYDGVDSNCDGVTEYDFDGDGADAIVYGGDDCDDADASRYPGAEDVVCDGIDQDCDGADDRDADDDGDDCDVDCDDADPARSSTAVEIPCDRVDQDCDGLDACFAPEPEAAEAAPAEDTGCGGGAASALLLLPLGLVRRRARRIGAR
ncbi:MAG: putative metal-binding motif-containing protein [Myxococcota bacterium]